MHKALFTAMAVLTAAAQTKIDLRTQAKDVDFSAATATKPARTGTTLPSTCSVGEVFFKTDATVGANLYGCTSSGTWTVQGGLTTTNCWYDSGDSTVKCRDTDGNIHAAVKTSTAPTANQWVDYISPAGVPHTSQPTAAAVGALADIGANGIPYRAGAGTTTVASANQLAAAFSCQDTGTLNAYACSLTPAISSYAWGTSYWFLANSTNTGPATVNFNGLGAKAILKQSSIQLAAGDIKAGQWVTVIYDGLSMQMQSQTGSPGSGAVGSVFGRFGQVEAQAGDYTTAQVPESGNLYFTNARAQQAFSFSGVVTLSSGSVDCPTCVTTATTADTDLLGSFPHLSVAKLQGRRVASTQPTDLQYLGWNTSSSQWEPKTLPTAPVATVFGRTGTVTSQSGDYQFTQISGTVAAGQLPATAMRTDSDNRVTSGTQDMRSADHTAPMKSGTIASLPSQCQVGETYFATDAVAGNNIYACTAANTWFAQGTNLTVASQGTVVGSRPKLNVQTGLGLVSVMSDTGSQIDLQLALNTTTAQTQAGEQSGRALYCVSSSGSGQNYRCSLTPSLGAYAAGMVLRWKPDVNGAGGVTTLNVDTLGAMRIRLRDGVSEPGTGDIVAGTLYEVWYDGTQFRLMTPISGTSSGSSGAVSSVFGRQGTVVQAVGDYNTDQVTEGSNLYFTNARALAAVTWDLLTGKPSTFTPSAHAASHRNGGSDEVGTSTPAANAIPKAGSDGKLGTGWLPTGATILGYTAENTANKGQVNGYASLDSTGKVPSAQLPTGSSGANAWALVFDGSTTSLADGTTVSWSCGSGSGAQCTASWTAPAGINWVRVQGWGGGGGGQDGMVGTAKGGGGGGGYWESICAVTPGNSYTVAVGKGGVRGGGNNGGNSSFGSCFTVVGGSGANGSSGCGGYRYSASGTPYNWVHSPATSGGQFTWNNCVGAVGVSGAGYVAERLDLGGPGGGAGATAAGNIGGQALGGAGGGGGGAYNNATAGSGGIALGGGGNGGAGGSYSSACVTAGDGSIPGGGGGGGAATASVACTGGSGARGEVRIYYSK